MAGGGTTGYLSVRNPWYSTRLSPHGDHCLHVTFDINEFGGGTYACSPQNFTRYSIECDARCTVVYCNIVYRDPPPAAFHHYEISIRFLSFRDAYPIPDQM